MYRCRQCDCDMTVEAEVEIAKIVNGPTPGQLFGANFDRAFECQACQEKNLAAARAPGSRRKKNSGERSGS